MSVQQLSPQTRCCRRVVELSVAMAVLLSLAALCFSVLVWAGVNKESGDTMTTTDTEMSTVLPGSTDDDFISTECTCCDCRGTCMHWGPVYSGTSK